ncbi:glycoside hydrolase 105 family protein [Salipaludibacillus neizhouensis]|uniref:Glycoside hydrolase 105 family protein n=1 Tax=Salipaludibacillus neizhouensis TaxID=885475 RepID=A0A3A9K9H2_9BACI|nr:glycoside hydrolase family 88 protein [Salipaludibacillus neizhouensis]RKL68178.1 glycoside hydrolase 105 family protein [Salipaludibacillus neizhouensis]
MGNQTLYQGKTAMEWAEIASESLMKQYDEPLQLPPANRWHYHQGVFLCGVLDVWRDTGKEAYYQYVKKYVDDLVDEEGNFYFRRDELDAIQPGLLLYPLIEREDDKRYKVALDKLRNLLETVNRTKSNGLWHKDKYPYQMWLDGLYMAGPFTMQYGLKYDEPELIEFVLHQEKLMRRFTKSEATGLYHHGWDESISTDWAVPEKGHAPEIWGRALGWYGMALTMLIELLPEDHPGRQELIVVLADLIKDLVRYQDKETGLWHQVVDKGENKDNWLETSCTSLFLLTIIRAVNQGYVDQSYYEYAKKGYEGILKHKVRFEGDRLILSGVCIGTSIGVYDYYMERETVDNDLHGVGAFILSSIQMHRYHKNQV